MSKERIRDGFCLSLPKKMVARVDIERGLVTRSAYVTSILAKVYNMKIPYPGRKIPLQGLDMEAKEVAPTPSTSIQEGVIRPNG